MVYAEGEIPIIMRVAMVVSPEMRLHPLHTTERDGISIMGLVYESLVRLDDDRKPSPMLATFTNPNGDSSTWDFKIKENILFHDGDELKAHDVVATMDYIKTLSENEDIPMAEKGLYYLMPKYCRDWEAVDDHTLRVRTDKGYQMLYAMTFPVLQAETIHYDQPPGTGPYTIDYYVPGQELSVVGNTNWRERPPRVSEVVGIWYKNDTAALNAFESERVDILMTRNPSAVRYRGTLSSRINTYDYATRQIEVLQFNLARKSLGGTQDEPDDKLRKAICHAIDKSRLIQNVYQNMVTHTDTLLSPGAIDLYTDRVTTYEYNPEKAIALLEELEWVNVDENTGYRYTVNPTDGTEKTLELRLGYYNEAGNTVRQTIATEITSMLNAVGIKVSRSRFTFAEAQKKLDVGTLDYDLFLCAYNFGMVPDPSFLVLPGNMNTTRYRSDVMKEYVKELNIATNFTEYSQAWRKIQVQMSRDLPMLPLYYRDGIVLSRYPYSAVRDIREYELLRTIERFE